MATILCYTLLTEDGRHKHRARDLSCPFVFRSHQPNHTNASASASPAPKPPFAHRPQMSQSTLFLPSRRARVLPEPVNHAYQYMGYELLRRGVNASRSSVFTKLARRERSEAHTRQNLPLYRMRWDGWAYCRVLWYLCKTMPAVGYVCVCTRRMGAARYDTVNLTVFRMYRAYDMTPDEKTVRSLPGSDWIP